MAAKARKASDLPRESSASKTKLDSLYKKRAQLREQLMAVERDILQAERAAGVSSNRQPGQPTAAMITRSQNEKSLKMFVQEALATNKKGLTILEIMDAVIRNGYTTNSSNFKNTLYQCLYHNEKTFVLDKTTKCYKLVKK